MGRFSELHQELARSERHLAEGQARIARQAEFVRELYAEGHDTSFAAKRLLVLVTNLNGMERQRSRSCASSRPLRRALRRACRTDHSRGSGDCRAKRLAIAVLAWRGWLTSGASLRVTTQSSLGGQVLDLIWRAWLPPQTAAGLKRP